MLLPSAARLKSGRTHTPRAPLSATKPFPKPQRTPLGPHWRDLDHVPPTHRCPRDGITGPAHTGVPLLKKRGDACQVGASGVCTPPPGGPQESPAPGQVAWVRGLQSWLPRQVRHIPPHRGWARVAPVGNETRHTTEACPARLWDLCRRLQGTLPGLSGHSQGPARGRRCRLRHAPRAPRTGSVLSSQHAFHTGGHRESTLPAGWHLPAWSENQEPGTGFYPGLSGAHHRPAMVNEGRVEVSFLTPSEPGFTCTWRSHHVRQRGWQNRPRVCRRPPGTPGRDPAAMLLEKDAFRWERPRALT